MRSVRKRKFSICIEYMDIGKVKIFLVCTTHHIDRISCKCVHKLFLKEIRFLAAAPVLVNVAFFLTSPKKKVQISEHETSIYELYLLSKGPKPLQFLTTGSTLQCNLNNFLLGVLYGV